MRVEPATTAVGAHVEVDLARVIETGDLFDAVQDALLEHHVLFFRDQGLSVRQFQALGERFGTLESHPAYPTAPEAPGVQILESTPEAPSRIEAWHSDMTFRETPPGITLLYGQVIPRVGGDTLWASAHAAYAGLSPALRTLVEGLRGVHDFAHGFRESLEAPGGYERLRDAVAANPPVTHPAVRTHPASGKRSLYVNRLFTTRLEGLSRRESDALLSFLYEEITTDEYTVRLRWRPGTIAIWDNRTTQHKPVNDYFPQHRKMYRLTVAGERPR